MGGAWSWGDGKGAVGGGMGIPFLEGSHRGLAGGKANRLQLVKLVSFGLTVPPLL